MGRKKRKKKDAVNLFLKYRWEFLRRNKRYIKAYKKFRKAMRTLTEREKKYNIFVFSVSWGINGLLNPRKSYEENMRLVKEDISFPPPVSLELESPILDCNVRGTIVIRLKYPKRAIIESFEEQLGHYIKEYKKTEHKQNSPETRAQIALYKRYLQIYDLREKGWNWERLVNKFYKGYVEDNKNYAKRKVQREHERCRELIERDYRQIR